MTKNAVLWTNWAKLGNIMANDDASKISIIWHAQFALAAQLINYKLQNTKKCPSPRTFLPNCI